jgi:hypothetical protein
MPGFLVAAELCDFLLRDPVLAALGRDLHLQVPDWLLVREYFSQASASRAAASRSCASVCALARFRRSSILDSSWSSVTGLDQLRGFRAFRGRELLEIVHFALEAICSLLIPPRRLRPAVVARASSAVGDSCALLSARAEEGPKAAINVPAGRGRYDRLTDGHSNRPRSSAWDEEVCVSREKVNHKLTIHAAGAAHRSAI